MKKLLNKSEAKVNDRLLQVCTEFGAKVFPKVRVADVLPIENSGISNNHYSYALRAHFDFVITDSSIDPIFAVEFDGPLHSDPDIKRKDEMKNDLCDSFGFPILRINARYINHKLRGMDLLTWLVETWFNAQEFHEAQVEGIIPMDEPFDPFLIIQTGNRGSFPYWLSRPAIIQIQRWYEQEKCSNSLISHMIATDHTNRLRALGWIKIDENHGVMSETGMRSKNFGFASSDLLGEIITLETYESLRLALIDKMEPILLDKIEERIEQFKTDFKIIRSLTQSLH